MLPHATGNVGVTEVNYGLAAVSLLNSFVPNRMEFYSQAVPVPEVIGKNDYWLRLINFFGNEEDPSTAIQRKHVALLGWYLMVSLLCVLSLGRVMAHTSGKRLSALSKLISPTLLNAAPFFVDPAVLSREARWFSLAFGLASTQITNKTIVFSMARQPVAAVQVKDVLPLILCAAWIHYDTRWKDPGITLLLKLVTLYYGIRIVRWTHAAIFQICERLEINLFTIKKRKKS